MELSHVVPFLMLTKEGPQEVSHKFNSVAECRESLQGIVAFARRPKRELENEEPQVIGWCVPIMTE